MTKGVFVIRSDSPYDDQPEIHYQFPAQYMSRASQFVDDWILYYEPVKSGPHGYHAAAKVSQIVPDPTRAAHFLALIEPGTYLTFEQGVPFRIAGELVERGVLNDQGRISGRAQSAVRPISNDDFIVLSRSAFRTNPSGCLPLKFSLPRTKLNMKLRAIARSC